MRILRHVAYLTAVASLPWLVAIAAAYTHLIPTTQF